MSSRSTQLIGGEDRQRAYVDGIDNGLAEIGAIHFNIHRGIVFTATATSLALADDGTLDVLLIVTNGTHMRFRAGVEGQATVSLFEGTTIAAEGEGTPVLAANRNRFSTNTATTTVFHTPTLTAAGDSLGSTFVPGGSGGNSQGAATSPTEEWILAAGNYMLRLTNISGNASDVSLIVEFYEPGLLS